jgi:hypothetical protein
MGPRPAAEQETPPPTTRPERFARSAARELRRVARSGIREPAAPPGAAGMLRRCAPPNAR